MPYFGFLCRTPVISTKSKLLNCTRYVESLFENQGIEAKSHEIAADSSIFKQALRVHQNPAGRGVGYIRVYLGKV